MGDFDGDKYGKFTPLSLEICREEIDWPLTFFACHSHSTHRALPYLFCLIFRPAMVEYPNYYPVLFFIHMTVQIGLTWSWLTPGPSWLFGAEHATGNTSNQPNCRFHFSPQGKLSIFAACKLTSHISSHMSVFESGDRWPQLLTWLVKAENNYSLVN